MRFSEEEREEYEQQLEEIPLKSLLIEQNALLHEILGTLEGAHSGEKVTLYECTMCSETVPESKRQRHLEESHNAPPDMDTSISFNPV